MGNTELMCANCGQALDPGDMYCRACGLPTVHAHSLRSRAAEAPPDLKELERALDMAPEPSVIERVLPAGKDATEPLDRLAFAAPARRGLSPLAIVLLIALIGAFVVFFLPFTLG